MNLFFTFSLKTHCLQGFRLVTQFTEPVVNVKEDFINLANKETSWNKFGGGVELGLLAYEIACLILLVVAGSLWLVQAGSQDKAKKATIWALVGIFLGEVFKAAIKSFMG